MGSQGHIDILGSHVATGLEWKGITDHYPITAQYRVALPSTKSPVLAAPPPTRPELDRSDPRILNDFTDIMRRYIERHPPTIDTLEAANSYLFKLERDTVKIVRRINRRYRKNRNRSDYKDGWSPHYAAMKIHMQTLFYIRRHLLQQKKYHRWHTDDDVFTGISNLVQQ
jgi:hypothetical protein